MNQKIFLTKKIKFKNKLMSESDESSFIINDEYDNSNDNIKIIPSSKVEISNKPNNENDINSKIIKNENKNDKTKTEEKKAKIILLIHQWKMKM